MKKSGDITTRTFKEQIDFYVNECAFSKVEFSELYSEVGNIYNDNNWDKPSKSEVSRVIKGDETPTMKLAETLAEVLTLKDDSNDPQRRGTRSPFLKAAAEAKIELPLRMLVDEYVAVKGVTKKALIEKSGISQRAFFNILTHDSFSSLDQATRFANALDFSGSLRASFICSRTGFVETVEEICGAIEGRKITWNQAVKNLLEIRKITMQQLAKQTGVPETTVNGWLNHKTANIPEYPILKKAMSLEALGLTEGQKKAFYEAADYAIDVPHIIEMKEKGLLILGGALKALMEIRYGSETNFCRAIKIEETSANPWVNNSKPMPVDRLETLCQGLSHKEKKFFYECGQRYVDYDHLVEKFKESSDPIALLNAFAAYYEINKSQAHVPKPGERLTPKRLSHKFDVLCDQNPDVITAKPLFEAVLERYAALSVRKFAR